MEKLKKSKKLNTRRVLLNVPIDLDNCFHDLAKERGIAKSSLIMYSMSFYRDYNTTLTMLPSLIEAINKSDEFNKSNKSNKSNTPNTSNTTKTPNKSNKLNKSSK